MFLIRAARPEYRDNYKTETEITHKTVNEIDWKIDDKELAEALKHYESAARHDE
jgi:hypothetical protein